MHIALAAAAALEQNHSFVLVGHINDHLAGLCFPDHRSLRHMHHHILSIGTMTPAFSARLSIACCILPDMPEII